MRPLAAEARRICLEAFKKVDSANVIAEHVICDATHLMVGDDRVPLAGIANIFVIAVGKAAHPMYRSLIEAVKASGIPTQAIVVSNERPGVSEAGAVFLHGSHPLPDAASVHAAQSALALLNQATPRTVVFFLISGGASAMLEQPLDNSISISDTAAFHRALIASGMPIRHMNVLRKHFSAVKGGRLAVAAESALRQYTLLVSDVTDDTPDVIGSGPSLPDPSTADECMSLLHELRAAAELPQSVLSYFLRLPIPETPKADDPVFRRARWRVLSSSENLAQAAASLACDAGFSVTVDNTCDDWEYSQAGTYLLNRARKLAETTSPCCLISVGEVTVRLPPEVGEGGRNQQFALWCARELARMNWAATVLSAGSDGIDGNSSAAGGVCDEETEKTAHRLEISVTDHLDRFDSAPLLRQLGADIVTGPTGNNLRDLRLILVA